MTPEKQKEIQEIIERYIRISDVDRGLNLLKMESEKARILFEYKTSFEYFMVLSFVFMLGVTAGGFITMAFL